MPSTKRISLGGDTKHIKLGLEERNSDQSELSLSSSIVRT